METTTSSPKNEDSLNNIGKIIAAVLGSVLIVLGILIWFYRRPDRIKRLLHRSTLKEASERDGRKVARGGPVDTGKGQSRVEMSELSEGIAPVSATGEGAQGVPGPSTNWTLQRRDSEILDKIERQPLPVSPPQSAASDTMLLPPTSNAGGSSKSLLHRFSLSRRPRSELPPLSTNPWGGSKDLLLPVRPHTMEIVSSASRSDETVTALPPKAVSARSPTSSAPVSPLPSSLDATSPQLHAQVQFEPGVRASRNPNTLSSGRTSTTLSHLSGAPSLSSIHTADLFFNFLRQSSSPSRSRPASSRQSSSPSSHGTLPFSAFGRRSSNPLQATMSQDLTDSPISVHLAGVESTKEEFTGVERRGSDPLQSKMAPFT